MHLSYSYSHVCAGRGAFPLACVVRHLYYPVPLSFSTSIQYLIDQSYDLSLYLLIELATLDETSYSTFFLSAISSFLSPEPDNVIISAIMYAIRMILMSGRGRSTGWSVSTVNSYPLRISCPVSSSWIYALKLASIPFSSFGHSRSSTFGSWLRSTAYGSSVVMLRLGRRIESNN